MKSKIYLVFVLFIICFGIWIIGFIILGNWYTDDAFIAFCYAKNFYYGFGLVFNQGQYVQGYTNFLWIILLAGLKFLGLNFQSSAILINSISYLILSYVIFNFLRKLFPDKSLTFYYLAVFLLLSAPNLISWVIGGGLEGPLFMTLLAVSLYFLLFYEKKLFASIFLVITTLIRPEGFLFFILALLYLLYFEKCKKNKLLIFILVYIIPIICYLIWAYYYYGDILPNTFYAKVSLSIGSIYEGIHYIYRYFMSAPLIFIILSLSIFGLKRKSKIIKFIWLSVIVFSCYLVCIGGDFMFAFRFFLPILPLICFLVIDEILHIFTLLKSLTDYRRLLYFIFIFLIFYNLLSLSYFVDYKYQVQNYKMISGGKILAEYLNKKYPTNYTIAASGIGALGFYSNMQVLDLLGLTSKVVAKEGIFGHDLVYSHGKSDSQYILRQRPQIIVFGMPPGEKFPVRFAEKEIYKSLLFHRNYIY
ncbi:MAG: hypothetical protein WBV81_00150, partial [Ignavibacteriaceae bacterium]